MPPARCDLLPPQGMKPLSVGLPAQPSMQLPQQSRPLVGQQPHATLQSSHNGHVLAEAPPEALSNVCVAEGHEQTMTFRQDLVSA